MLNLSRANPSAVFPHQLLSARLPVVGVLVGRWMPANNYADLS